MLAKHLRPNLSDSKSIQVLGLKKIENVTYESNLQKLINLTVQLNE